MELLWWNHKVLLWPHAAFRTFHLSKLLYRRQRAIVYLSHTQPHHTRHLYSCRWFNNFIFPPSVSLSFPSPPHAERTEQREMKNISSNTQQMQLYRRAGGGNDWSFSAPFVVFFVTCQRRLAGHTRVCFTVVKDGSALVRCLMGGNSRHLHIFTRRVSCDPRLLRVFLPHWVNQGENE